jgi:hypothetical protein
VQMKAQVIELWTEIDVHESLSCRAKPAYNMHVFLCRLAMIVVNRSICRYVPAFFLSPVLIRREYKKTDCVSTQMLSCVTDK